MDGAAPYPPEGPPSRSALNGLERAVVLILWLIMVIGLFSPWEIFISPTGSSLDTAPQEYGLSHVILQIEYAVIGILALLRPAGMLKTLFRAWPILLLCGWILLSATWSAVPGNSLNKGVRTLSVIVFSFYVAYRYSPSEFTRLCTQGFAIAVGCSLAVMVVAPHLGRSNLGGGYENAWRGAFTHKNSLGSVMSLGVIVSGYSYAIRATSRKLAGFTIVGCLFLLIMSQSATAILSTALALSAVSLGAALQSRRSPVLRGSALIGIVFGIVGLILLPIIAANVDLSHLPTVIGRSSTLTGRTGVWSAVIEAIRARPFFGYGYGFWDQPSTARSNIWLEVDWQAPHAHNNWLDGALQLGLVGVTLAAIIWLSILCRCLWLIAVRRGNGALFYLAILLCILVRSMFETVMFTPGIQALFWLVICYVYVSGGTRQRAAAVAAGRDPIVDLSAPVPAHALHSAHLGRHFGIISAASQAVD